MIFGTLSDVIEKNKDYLILGDQYCRVLFLKDYASYIKDSMVTELTDLNRNMMLSIDILPIPTDEAVHEVESRLLGVETTGSAAKMQTTTSLLLFRMIWSFSARRARNSLTT